MATNKIYSFAQQSLNVLTDEEYEADKQRLIGHQPGIARAGLQNKASKQSNIMAAALAQFGVNGTGKDVNDSMPVEEITEVITEAVKSIAAPDIATPNDINVGTVGKLVDATGLLKHLSNRFTIIYSNGGTAEKPAEIKNNSRYVLDNPFPGHFVMCQVEVLFNGQWGDPGWSRVNYYNTWGAGGSKASQLGDKIILQTGMNYVMGAGGISGGSFPEDMHITSIPCRVKVFRID